MQALRMKSFAKGLNDLTFMDYYKRLSHLARATYKWNDLPPTIEERWNEKFLFDIGYCVVFNDPMRGLMVTQCALDGDLNHYGEPTTVTPVGNGVEPRTLTIGKDCVLIRNNDDMTPTAETIKLFAYRLAEISRTIDINVHAQKTPVLIQGSEKQKQSLKNAYAQWNGNEPVIFTDNQLDLNGVTVLRTDAPKVFPDLQRQKIDIWNEALTFLGINNANTEKRERLITDEVQANDTHIELSAQCMLKARKTAAEEINRIFGTSITVERREEEEAECEQDTPNTSET